MRQFIFALTLLGAQTISYSQEKLSVSQWLDTFIDSCVGSGSSQVVSGGIDATGQVSLRKATISGEITGGVTLTKSQFRLLSEGISSKMTAISADQADKVRVCLEPMRRTMLKVMNQQLGGGQISSALILSPEEDKVLIAIANIKGIAGQSGQLTEREKVRSNIGMSDIRFQSVTGRLKDKFLIVDLGVYISLMPKTVEYLVDSGLAN